MIIVSCLMAHVLPCLPDALEQRLMNVKFVFFPRRTYYVIQEAQIHFLCGRRSLPPSFSRLWLLVSPLLLSQESRHLCMLNTKVLRLIHPPIRKMENFTSEQHDKLKISRSRGSLEGLRSGKITERRPLVFISLNHKTSFCVP